MDFLTPEQAHQRWEAAYRILSVKGNTILYNDPDHFLCHYYHFVAELFLGTWAFWQGAFTQPSPFLIRSPRTVPPTCSLRHLHSRQRKMA
ncbi:hypothetical protein F5887DRAFT_971681 [Amanita rubescens]|nr:hypothetical protein F5887DRAFT_1004418 [Amanita rubescens]KAF8331533.1 hypothetical protein F5887DRAFT_998367 [Amanita rubescens]KAF8343690.1 hypothetical protein F5887DRAFT_971681 [Amanita rubescens]